MLQRFEDAQIEIENLENEIEELESENERCRKKCESLINHLIRAREKGFYDFENVTYKPRSNGHLSEEYVLHGGARQ